MASKIGGKRKRLDGAGRRAFDEEMEEESFECITELRRKNLRVGRREICIDHC